MLLTPNNANIFQDHMSNRGREKVSECESKFVSAVVNAFNSVIFLYTML